MAAGSLDDPLVGGSVYVIDLLERSWNRISPNPLYSFGDVDAASQLVVGGTLERMEVRNFRGEFVRTVEAGAGLGAEMSPDGKTLAVFGRGREGVRLYPWPEGPPAHLQTSGAVGGIAWSAGWLAVGTAGGIEFFDPTGRLVAGTAAGAFLFTRPRSSPWSPDGSTLVFARMGNRGATEIYLVEPGKPERFLSSLAGGGPDVQWSSDGSLLALHQGADVSVVEVATGRVRFVITNAGYRYIRWSPFEPVLLLDGNACLRDWQPMLINADGSGFRGLLASRPSIWPTAATWTPDGTEVVVSWGSLLAIETATGAARTIATGPATAVTWVVEFVTRDLLVIRTASGGACETGEVPPPFAPSRVLFPQ